jgi:DNA-binding CsgD family transcriptional regulator
MTRHTQFEHNRQKIVQLCHSALDARTLRNELLRYLRSVIPFDYAYFTTTDPATQLGTNSVLVEQPPSWCMSVFLHNEFLQQDFNKFNDMVRYGQTVSILSEATENDLHRSPRYRDMLLPMRMGDELRAIFITDAACWGTLCLHREQAKTPYTAQEAGYLAQLVTPIADGLRKAFLLSRASSSTMPHEPGVLLLTDDLTPIAATAAAEYWLVELNEGVSSARSPMPLTIQSVIASLKAVENGRVDATPKLRLHTRSGHWLVLHAARMTHSTQISVIFEVAQPAEIAPLLMQAYGLTKREGEITQCVVRGWSTTEITARLHISPHTVQDHLKAIFEKVAVNSRGELAARIFVQQHQSPPS